MNAGFRDQQELRTCVQAVIERLPTIDQFVSEQTINDALQQSCQSYTYELEFDEDELFKTLVRARRSKKWTADEIVTDLTQAGSYQRARFRNTLISLLLVIAFFVSWVSIAGNPFITELTHFQAHLLILVGFSLLMGHLVVSLFSYAFDSLFPDSGPRKGGTKGLLVGTVTGSIERPFFTLAIAYGLGGVVIAMFGWMTLRNVVFWSSLGIKPIRKYVSLMLAFVSMFVALISGLVLAHLIK